MKGVVMTKEYYTHDEVVALMIKNNLDINEFHEWMYGQTCPVIDGEICYFTWDVVRFIRNYSQSLIAKYIRGDLSFGYYYVLRQDGVEGIHPEYVSLPSPVDFNPIVDILSPVPSYEEWINKETIRV